jgi:hypothetical protein
MIDEAIKETILRLLRDHLELEVDPGSVEWGERSDGELVVKFDGEIVGCIPCKDIVREAAR